MEVIEIIQGAYRDYEFLARDPDYQITDVRKSFAAGTEMGQFATTLDLRFVNVVNQVRQKWRLLRALCV